MYAITIEPGKYLNTIGHAVAYTNHSCEPTLIFSKDDLTFRTTRDVNSGEIFTFDYATTESEIIAPFKCECGTKACRGTIGLSLV